MVRKLKFKIDIISATVDDYDVIRNMWPFYIYDMGRECGFNEGWECPTNIGFVADDISSYFKRSIRKAFIIKVNNELAGFVFLKGGKSLEVEWTMSEFFIVAKFQGKGIGKQVAYEIWKMYRGCWTVPVIPENKSAIGFWRSTIAAFTGGQYREKIKDIDSDKGEVRRVVFGFKSDETFSRNL
jgi:predicted acetyltransferase